MDVEELFDRYVSGTGKSEDYIKWAEDQLAAGSNSANIAILAEPFGVRSILFDFRRNT